MPEYQDISNRAFGLPVAVRQKGGPYVDIKRIKKPDNYRGVSETSSHPKTTEGVWYRSYCKRND